MSAWSAFLFGVIQGITEWIPVSSQGVVSVAATWLDGVSASDAIAIALWLHVGTAVSATGALRGEIVGIVREAAATPRSLPQPVPFLIVSTVVTGVVGVPLFLVLGEAADRFGAVSHGCHRRGDGGDGVGDSTASRRVAEPGKMLPWRTPFSLAPRRGSRLFRG